MNRADFAEHLAADRRLVILRLLIEGNGELGESSIEHGLLMLGHRAGVDRDYVLGELDNLKILGLVEVEQFNGRVTVAAITKKGVAVAEGRVQVEGVKKPSLGR